MMKAIGAALLLLSSMAAQNNSPVTATGAFFALSVSDLRTSTQWYEQKLGLKVVKQVPKKDGVAVAILESRGLMVELIERDGAVSLLKAAPTVKDNTYLEGIFKAGVIVDDFEKTVANLKSHGVEIAYGPFAAKGSEPANVIVRDNDGNLIQFFGKK